MRLSKPPASHGGRRKKSCSVDWARIVHEAGLDWWRLDKLGEVRFGRRNPGDERAVGVLGVMSGRRMQKISWRRELGAVPKFRGKTLTDELVSQIETALAAERKPSDRWLAIDAERPGFLPDQLRGDPIDPDEDEDEGDEAPPLGKTSRPPFNRIYYGPPGTGKTYMLTELMKQHYSLAVS